MKFIKIFFTGIILGSILGFWTGANYGKKKPLFSNPFKEKTFKEKVLDTAQEIIDETK